MRTKPASLERSELLCLRNKAFKPSLAVLSQFKSLGILKYRGQRGAGNSRSTSSKKIPVMQGPRFVKAEGRKVDRSNLRNVPLVNTTNKTSTSKSTGFAVPKCLFTNICSLSKTKNRVRAPVAHEADLRSQDIDVCVVSETRLSTNMPDAVVNIPNYNVFRRDRGWADLDKRKKRGCCGCEIRSVHSWRQVAATRCSDTSQRQIASCVLEKFCENLCLRNIILSPQQVTKNQIRQNLCDLLLRQNSVAETKIFTKILLRTRSDLSLQRVAVTCCCN